MGVNDDHAADVIRIYAEVARDEGVVFMTYKMLAKRLGRPGEERLLADVLDRARVQCRQLGLPDIATMVVSQDALHGGTVRPAVLAASKYNDWHGLRAAQAKVMTFDWSSWRDAPSP